ncbi:MAG TPA: peptidylprolyl isomerase [Gemmataceae bacterium]|nr:peptidylprolyl isomerase [Gemmataceae bacterium]
MNGLKWTVGGLTGTLALLCAAGGALAQQASAPAATVNGEVITVGELETWIKKSGPMPVPLPEAQRKQQQQLVLNSLIEAMLLRQFLEKNAPPIDEKEINGRMADLVTQLRQQGRSMSDFCRELSQSEAQVRANVAATFRWYAYAEKHVTDQDLARCYQENKDLFDRVQVRVSEILQRVPTKADLSERELIRKHLQELREKLLANQITFEEAAKQYSQSETKDQGGDLDWIPHLRGGVYPLLPQHIVDLAFGMQPGQVSDVIDSEYGVYLIKVTQRDPGHPSEFDKVKQAVRDLSVEEMKMSILNQQRKSSDIKILLQ